jgi:hypothetical protein
MKARRAVVALSVASAAVAETVGAVSLTRIAGDHLGFPAGLAWTFTASVAVGAVAGAIMWSVGAAKSGVRSTGVQLNVACSVLCAAGVGLDHAVNATSHRAWQVAAFLVGAFLPLLSTWLVHALAKIGVPETQPLVKPDEKAESVVVDEPEFVEPAPITPRVVQRSLDTVPEVDAETVAEIDEIEAGIREDSPTPTPSRLTAVSSTSPPWGRRARELKRKGVKHATAYRQAKREWHEENEASA